MTCPDSDCAASFDAVGTLEELQRVACDCGCALEIERLAESEESPTDGLEVYALV